MGQSQSTSVVVQQIKQDLGNNDDLYAFPDEPFYQQDHVKRYNLDISTTPYAVTYPETAEQVSRIVKTAVKYGLKVQGKCGGHSYANYSSPDGGIVVDLKNMQKFEMNTTTWRATAGGGTLLGDLTRRMYDPHRRAMAHGICPQVGLGGHATIGGLGPSSRLFGAALDHVEEVEVVLADGRIIRASDNENADIFWALKGAGGSFGIITEFLLRTEEAPGEAVQYSYAFTTGTWHDIAKAFKAWQKFISETDLPRQFASTATITELGLTISGTYFGTKEEFDKLALQPGFPISAVVIQTIVFKDFLGLLGHWTEDVALKLGGAIPAHSYTKTLTFGGCELIPDPVVDAIFAYIKTTPKATPLWFAIFDLAGGYVNTIPMDATAFAHRDALFYLQAYAINATGPVKAETKAFLGGLNTLIQTEMAKAGQSVDFGAYPGYVDPELKDAQQKYWRSNLPRLEKIKGQYDPGDVFHNLQSVRPNGKEVPFVPPRVPGAAPAKGKGLAGLWQSLTKAL